MSRAALAATDLESESLFHAFLKRLKFSEAAQEWARLRQSLTRWEDENLLVANPSAEALERHRKMVERLMFFGQFFAFVASHPEFDQVEIAEMIQANQFILREKYLMFHNPNPISDQEADLILKEVFPES
jgi:hypothetical protein